MPDLMLLSPVQMSRIEPFFPIHADCAVSMIGGW